MAQHGLSAGQLTIDDLGLDHLISGYTREAGVRELERKLGALCRSLAANVSTANDLAAAAVDSATGSCYSYIYICIYICTHTHTHTHTHIYI